jgi:predicted nucleic acid-binding protein
MAALIVLDTNVVSEMMRDTPDESVAAWYIRQQSSALYTTTVTVAEVLYGIELLPQCKRRNRLTQFAEDFFKTAFAGKIIDFDQAAAPRYASIRAAKRLKGMTMSSLDTQIAAIAAAMGAAVATRNVNDFKHCGVKVINPWNG